MLKIILKDIARNILGRLGYFSNRFREQEFILSNIVEEASDILDVGCSDSILPLKLAKAGYRVTGLDVRDYPMKHPNFTFVRASINDPKIFHGKTKIFDVIVCLSTLEHVGIGFNAYCLSSENVMLEVFTQA